MNTSATRMAAVTTGAGLVLLTGDGVAGYALGNPSDTPGVAFLTGTPSLRAVASRASATGHNDVDLVFPTKMIKHHQKAPAMARLADDSAGSPHVRRLAAEIEATERAEIDKMKRWLSAWGDSRTRRGGKGSLSCTWTAA